MMQERLNALESGRSNRTFMELKYVQPMTLSVCVMVLIVPLWN